MKKVLFFDLDGVLIYQDTKICPKVIEALEGLRKKGHHPIACTGRGENNIPKELYEHMDGFITLAGARVSFNGKTLFDSHIEKQEVIKTLQEAKQLNCPIYPEGVDHMYAFNIVQGNEDIREKYLLEVCDYVINDVDEWLKEYNDANIYKFSLSKFSYEGLKNLTCVKNKTLNLVDSGDGYYEINQTKVSKGTAILDFLKIVNVDLKDTYCFGDSENDLGMFEVCGTKVAMGNALDIVKQKADIVCGNCYDGGVHDILKELNLI